MVEQQRHVARRICRLHEVVDQTTNRRYAAGGRARGGVVCQVGARPGVAARPGVEHYHSRHLSTIIADPHAEIERIAGTNHVYRLDNGSREVGDAERGGKDL